MDKTEPLPAVLSTDKRRFNIVLFSQPDCEFCAEERTNYLKPLAALLRPNLTIAEVELEASKTMRDWRGRIVRQGEFAKAIGARFAPTIMFFSSSGTPVAEQIVGL